MDSRNWNILDYQHHNNNPLKSSHPRFLVPNLHIGKVEKIAFAPNKIPVGSMNAPPAVGLFQPPENVHHQMNHSNMQGRRIEMQQSVEGIDNPNIAQYSSEAQLLSNIQHSQIIMPMSTNSAFSSALFHPTTMRDSSFSSIPANSQPSVLNPSVANSSMHSIYLPPNINATKANKVSVEASDASPKQVTAKYKKPNRIFIACTRCHKSKIRCLQLSEDEIATLPQEHVNHMVQLIGKINAGALEKKSKTDHPGINYPCKRCYNANKICVYDHSRIGRGRKPRGSKQKKPEPSADFQQQQVYSAAASIADNAESTAVPGDYNSQGYNNDQMTQLNVAAAMQQNTDSLNKPNSVGVHLQPNKSRCPSTEYSMFSGSVRPAHPSIMFPEGSPYLSLNNSHGNSPTINSYLQGPQQNSFHFQGPPQQHDPYNSTVQSSEMLNNQTSNSIVHQNPNSENGPESDSKIFLSEFKVKEYITVANLVRDNFSQQLQRSSYVSNLTDMIASLDKLTDVEMDMDNFDIIKMGILSEQECARRYELFKSKMVDFLKLQSIHSLVNSMDWLEFKQRYPKLFLTIISSSSMVYAKDSVIGFDVMACYRLSNATLKMIFFYGKKKQLKTLEMYLCITIVMSWDNIYQGINWKDYKDFILIFQDYLETVVHNNLDVSLFIAGDIPTSLETVITKSSAKSSENRKQYESFNSVLLTDEKKLELPAVAVILELSCFYLSGFLNDCSEASIVAKVPHPHINNAILVKYSDSLKNSSSIYHQNLNVIATLTHFFMSCMESNRNFKILLFPDLKKSAYFETLASQVEVINSQVHLIAFDNKRLRLCLHSMKAQLHEILIESLLLSYSKVRHDAEKVSELFQSIDKSILDKICDFLAYSFDCINELDKMKDDLLIILPNSYIARISLCFNMILKLLRFTLTNTKKFEIINQRILEFSLKNITITYRCAKLLEIYPCNTLLQRLQTVCTHAYFAEITYWKKAIEEKQYIIDQSDARIAATLKDFNLGFESCEQMTNILFKYTDSFSKVLDWKS